MTAPSTYPLAWPIGVPRTAARKTARFSEHGGKIGMKPVTLLTARERLQGELDRLGVSGTAILSTNVELTLSGQPRSGRPEPEDTGAVVYFTLNKKAIALPCDRWTRVADNVTALAKHIESLRGMERWGVGTVEQAFAGFAALPAPDAPRHWTAVLALTADANRDAINQRYRQLARDAGPNEVRLLELNLARDAALADKPAD